MTELVATTPGLYPLPDWAKRDLEDLKGHQKHDLISGDEGEEIIDVYQESRSQVIERQQEANLDLVVEGQLRWDDMLVHPFAVHDAVDTRGIVRYYDNNNFYRETVVTDELSFNGDIAAELEEAEEQTDSLMAVLPGPYSLADLATDEYYSDEQTFVNAVGEFIAEEANAFPEVEALFLPDPSLVTAPPEDDVLSAVKEALNTVSNAVDAPVLLHPYWEAFDEDTYTTVLDTDIDAVGFDLINAAEKNKRVATEYGIPDSVVLGVVDGQNTRVESSAEINNRVDQFTSATSKPETAYITSNTGLFYLPMNRFGEKLDALGAATEYTEVEA